MIEKEIKEAEIRTQYDAIRGGDSGLHPEHEIFLNIMADAATFHRPLSRYINKCTARLMQENVYNEIARQELMSLRKPAMKATYHDVVIELRRLCQKKEMREYISPILQDLDEGLLALEERVDHSTQRELDSMTVLG